MPSKTKRLTPIEIFDQIEAMILEEPKRIRMEGFAFRPREIPDSERPACDTVACLAGWAVAIVHDKRGEELWNFCGIPEEAQKLLGLNALQMLDLFYEYPDGRYGTKAYAEAVVAHMEKFRNSVPHLRRKP